MTRGRSVTKAGQRFSGPAKRDALDVSRVVGELIAVQAELARVRVEGWELLDMDDDTVESQVVEVRDVDTLMYQIVPNTGPHTNHIVVVEGRVASMIDPGGADVEPNFRPINSILGSPVFVQGGNLASVDVRGLDQVQFSVAVAEGSPSTAYVAWNGVSSK